MSNRKEKRENWRRTIEEAMKHPNGIAGYARAKGLSAGQLYTRKCRLGRVDQAKAPSIPPESFCRVELIEPKRPQLPDAKWVAELILALQSGAL
jgi:hypothetical protein